MNKSKINPDGVERTRTSSSLLDSVFKATLGLNPNLNLSPVKYKELFIISMCMIAEYFFENPLDYVDYGFLRVYKPDGKGKFLIWEVTAEHLFWHPEEVTKMAIGEGSLIEEFKKQLIEFIQSVTKMSISEEASMREIISRLNQRRHAIAYNRSATRLEKERIRDRARYPKERERRLARSKERRKLMKQEQLEKEKRLKEQKKLEEQEMINNAQEEKENKDGN